MTMTDTVERLREGARLLEEAADEITTLRQQVKMLAAPYLDENDR